MRKAPAVAIWVMLTGAGRACAQESTDAVRNARTTSNKAIIARRMDDYMATITPDFVITTGSGKAYTREEFLAAWAKLFANTNWHGCDRIVDGIEMSLNQPTAAERGHFVCAADQPDGRQVYTGTYLAMWRKDAGVWRTRSELFVTLTCVGSEVCKAPRL